MDPALKLASPYGELAESELVISSVFGGWPRFFESGGFPEKIGP
jgi:hypothetical protein